MRDKYNFLHQDKHQSFLHAGSIQSTHNNKFVVSLLYLKKEGRDEVDFLLADKHQTILQVDTVNLSRHCQAYPK